jgi:HAD superfamily hydrolase (TIGR01490 family)
LSVNSAPLYARYLRRHGLARRRDLLRAGWYLAQYRLGRLDIEKAAEKAGSTIRGRREVEVAAFAERWYQEMVRDYLVPQVCALLAAHQSAGDRVAILSSTTAYLAEPLSRDLGVEDLLVTRLETEAGRFTGRIIPPICYGEGKVAYARNFASEYGIALEESWFYTDSITDLPVLELVGKPRVVAPDRLLRREAARRGWPVIDP